jgi:hypothetical protein
MLGGDLKSPQDGDVKSPLQDGEAGAGPKRESMRAEAQVHFGNVVNVMTTPPLFFCKNVILKRLEREVAQECDSKGVRCDRVLSRTDFKGFACRGRVTKRAIIGDLAWIRAAVRIVSNIIAQKLSNVNW